MNRLLRTLTFPCLLAAVLTLWLRWQPLSPPDSGFVLEMGLLSPTTGEAWLRFNLGDGWNFPDTRVFSVTESATPKRCRVALPPGVFKSFRLRLPEATAAHALTVARIVDADGAVVATLPAAGYSEAVKTIPFALETPLRLTAPWEKSWFETALDFAVLATVFALASILLAARAEAFVKKTRARAIKLASWFPAHPRLTLLAVALLAVAASCHPVVFFGRSFVSPNNGALCLYDVHPALPGAAATFEQPSNSDVMATMWAHLPYSMLSHDAARAGELPLWNRYAMGGLTLLGQGQSMPGDPLFWLTAWADGAAWAWDLRFLISKTLFAFGIGLLVLTTTRRLGIAALLAASSAFIGFFAFRFNHPSFFSVCYAPWILLAWLRAAASPSVRGAGAWALAVLAADWLELNSGTAKEASMLLLAMNGTGALVLLLAGGGWLLRWKKLALMAAGGLAFLALSAPLWVVFLGALDRSFTIYDEPKAFQLPAALLIALFDDLFGRQLMASEWHVDPAVNFFVLLGVLWLLANLRKICAANRVALAVFLASLPLLALVFGVIAPSWIVRLPLLKNIVHTDDTFIATLIVPLFVLAGFGLAQGAKILHSPTEWRAAWQRALALLGALAAIYFGTVQAVPRPALTLIFERPTQFSPFFLGYSAALLAGVALLPWFARRLALHRGSQPANLLCAALLLAALHFRHGMWLDTKFDTYVMNPQPRVTLQASSPAVEIVRAASIEPARTLGFGGVLNPGFNTVLHLESTAGADALVPKDLMEWNSAAGLPLAAWTPELTPQNLAGSQRVYDAMNVRYYLGPTAGAHAVPGLKKIASADLEVFASETAWPRAFFTDRLARYPDVRTLMGWIKSGDGWPFAAVPQAEPKMPDLPADQGPRLIAAARDYRLTANTTSFTIDAPHAGIAVLNESFVRDDFRARVNGQPAPVFRVNHIFKGVALPAAGTFRVEFSYWPHLLTPALYAALAGLLSVLAGAVWLLRPPSRRASCMRPPAPRAVAALSLSEP